MALSRERGPGLWQRAVVVVRSANMRGIQVKLVISIDSPMFTSRRSDTRREICSQNNSRITSLKRPKRLHITHINLLTARMLTHLNQPTHIPNSASPQTTFLQPKRPMGNSNNSSGATLTSTCARHSFPLPSPSLTLVLIHLVMTRSRPRRPILLPHSPRNDDDGPWPSPSPNSRCDDDTTM
ncbi:hypothetical protein OG21DRAFT_1310704 [Imleria badia]|nr:hypothetical protein OG21DRAFT_1310704 [Imleria badia]